MTRISASTTSSASVSDDTMDRLPTSILTEGSVGQNISCVVHKQDRIYNILITTTNDNPVLSTGRFASFRNSKCDHDALSPPDQLFLTISNTSATFKLQHPSVHQHLQWCLQELNVWVSFMPFILNHYSFFHHSSWSSLTMHQCLACKQDGLHQGDFIVKNLLGQRDRLFPIPSLAPILNPGDYEDMPLWSVRAPCIYLKASVTLQKSLFIPLSATPNTEVSHTKVSIWICWAIPQAYTFVRIASPGGINPHKTGAVTSMMPLHNNCTSSDIMEGCFWKSEVISLWRLYHRCLRPSPVRSFGPGTTTDSSSSAQRKISVPVPTSAES